MQDTGDWVMGEFCCHSPLLSMCSILLYGHIAVEHLIPGMRFEQGEKEFKNMHSSPTNAGEMASYLVVLSRDLEKKMTAKSDLGTVLEGHHGATREEQKDCR
jgi:hypothetical protein